MNNSELVNKVKSQMNKMNLSYEKVSIASGDFNVEVRLSSLMDYDVVMLMLLKQMVGAEKMVLEMEQFDYETSYLNLNLKF